MELTAEEVRVVGCLLEKQATTPDQYPLSTNALVNACNQKSNREPAVDYSEATVIEALLSVRQSELARTNGSGRADKHRHMLHEALGLDTDQLALLAIMLLRGPQSTGELMTRTSRYPTSVGTGFEDSGDVESLLLGLAERSEPLVANIGRASGQSQDRWCHLMGDSIPDVNDAPTASPVAPRRSEADAALLERIEELETRLAALETALGISPPADTDGAAESD